MTLKQAIVKKQPGVGAPDIILYDDASPTYLVAQLAAVDLTAGEQSVTISGRLAPNDGAGGTFVKTPTGALVVDNGIIFASASAAYVWCRVYSGAPDVRWWGATGNGVADDGAAITAALASAAVVNGGSLYFHLGTYAYAASPNFVGDHIAILADIGTVFKHTGHGVAFNIDGGDAGGGVMAMTFENITVEGNVNSDHGIFVRSVHHSRFVNMRVTGCAVTGAAVRIEWCVCNSWLELRVTSNEGAFTSIPAYGVFMTSRTAPGDATTDQVLINPILEGLPCGLYIERAGGCQVFGGTMEGCTDGAIIAAASYGQNTFFSTDFEANINSDITRSGGAGPDIFWSIYALGTLILNNNANGHTFVGGRFHDISAASSFYNCFIGVLVTGTLIDSATPDGGGGIIPNEWINCRQSTGALVECGRSRGGWGGGWAYTVYGASVAIDGGWAYTVYGASVAIDAARGNTQIIRVSDGNAFQIESPVGGVMGQQLTILIRNTSGGAAGVATFAADYHLAAAWVQPATGNNRSITFVLDENGHWLEISRTVADVPN